MINEEDFEDEISQMLSAIAGAESYPLPEDQEEYKTVTTTPYIFTEFSHFQFTSQGREELSQSSVVQEAQIFGVITIQSRVRRGPLGIFDLRKKISELLLGYTPSNCDRPIFFTYFGPPKKDDIPVLDACWLYELHFCTRTPALKFGTADDPTITPANPIFNFLGNSTTRPPLIQDQTLSSQL